MSWSLGMQVSKLSQVLALSWVLLVASVALSTLLQVAVAPRSLVGYVTAGATPVWLLGSFAVLSLLYRAQLPDAVPAVDVDQDHDAGQAGERQRWRPVADLVLGVRRAACRAHRPPRPGRARARPAPL